MATVISTPAIGRFLSSATRVQACKTTSQTLSWKGASLPIGLGLSGCPSLLSAARLCPPNAMREGGVEPDLPEEDIDDLRTAGEGEEDTFPYGVADGHHTWHEGDDGTFWEGIKEVFSSAGGPTGGQAYLSVLTLPVLYAAVAFNIQVEYVLLGMVLFIFAFIGIEMAKPPKPSEFPPDVYMQLRKK